MKILFALLLASINLSNSFGQNVQLHYSGNNTKIIESVSEANKVLTDAEFLTSVEKIQKFDNTLYSGSQIVKEMESLKIIEVDEYYKRHTKTNAKTQTQIRINTAKLDRSLASRVNTLVHETIHATDWLTNNNWDYTHRTQYVENPAISAPYVIGLLAEKMVH